MIGRLRVVEMEDVWVWRHQQGRKAGTGLSEYLGHTAVSKTPAIPSSFTTHQEIKNDLMIHRSGTEWRHWPLPDPKEYKNTYWRTRHPERIVRHKRDSTDGVMDPGSHSLTEVLLFLAARLMLVTTNMLLPINMTLGAWINENTFSFNLNFRKNHFFLL